jgi:hypothetical protein
MVGMEREFTKCEGAGRFSGSKYQTQNDIPGVGEDFEGTELRSNCSSEDLHHKALLPPELTLL